MLGWIAARSFGLAWGHVALASAFSNQPTTNPSVFYSLPQMKSEMLVPSIGKFILPERTITNVNQNIRFAGRSVRYKAWKIKSADPFRLGVNDPKIMGINGPFSTFYAADGFHHDIISRGLAAITDTKANLRCLGIEPHTRGIEISPQLTARSISGDIISLKRYLQSTEHQNDADERQNCAEAGNPVSNITNISSRYRGLRCFFSRNSRAPLGAQIGALMVLVAITAVGIAVGVGRIVFDRRGKFAYMLLGIGSWLLFMWWSSPC